MTASEFVNEKLGDKNYTHSKYPMYRSEIEEWLNEYHEQQLKILNIPDVMVIVCPNCGSHDVIYEPDFNPNPKCLDCDHVWAYEP